MTEEELWRLAERVLGGRVEKWRGRDRWSHKTKGSEPRWSTQWSGTTAELLVKMAEEAREDVAKDERRLVATVDKLASLPATFELERAELLQQHESRLSGLREIELSDRERAARSAKRLADVLAAVGGGVS